jgi:hypothetical protein
VWQTISSAQEEEPEHRVSPRRPLAARGGRPLLWCAGAVLFLALVALLSYGLGGNEVWKWTAWIWGVILVFTVLGVLRVLDELEAVHYLFLLCFLLGEVCWVSMGVVYGYRKVEVELSLEKAGSEWKEGEEGLYLPVRITYDGEVLAAADALKSHSFAVRRFRPERLQIEVLRPQGWTTWRMDRVLGERVSVKPITVVSLFIDNRDHATVALACGAVQREVAAGQSAQWTFAAPDPPARYPLRIDGRDAGRLAGANYLLDVAGTRTYRLREMKYTQFVLLGEGEGPRPTVFKPAHLHQLPQRIDYFLSPAPESITVKEVSINGITIPALDQTRWELVELP